jgi:hypothetical protein
VSWLRGKTAAYLVPRKTKSSKYPLPGCRENFQKFQIAGCKNAFPDAYPLRGGFSNRRTAQGTKCEVCADRRNQKSLSAKGAKTPFSPATPWEDFNKNASRRKKFAEQLVKTVFSPATPLGGLFTSGANRTKEKCLGCTNRRK